MIIGGKVEGLQEMNRALDSLKAAMRNRILRKAVDAAANPVLRSAKANLRSKGRGKGAGQLLAILRRSLGKKVKATTKVGAYAVVGPRKEMSGAISFTWPDGSIEIIEADPAKFAHFVESGRGAVAVARAPVLAGHGQFWGQEVAAAAPQPFMRPAYESNVWGMKSIISETVANELEKEASRARVKSD